MYIGNKNIIDTTSSRFKGFIEEGNLYVDKTIFVEHILKEASTSLMFTRQHGMGKSLNLSTLATFLDCKAKTAHLFSGLYIERSEEFAKVNKYPVIYLNFKDYKIDNYKQLLRRDIIAHIEKYLTPDQYGWRLPRYMDDEHDFDSMALNDLMKILADVYGKSPYLLIDDYDKPFIDNINHAELPKLWNDITYFLSSALKDNPYLGKGVVMGVTRIIMANMYSGLNNLAVYDVLNSRKYDADFSLTETELTELVPDERINGARRRCGNMRVGKELLYNIRSVMDFLRDSDAELQEDRVISANESLLGTLLNERRAETIKQMLVDEKYRYDTFIENNIVLEHLKKNTLYNDTPFYTLAVQAGYLSFETDGYDVYRVYIPNTEARRVWTRLILETEGKL